MTAENTGAAATEVGDDLARELESGLRGRLIRPTDGDYDEARLVWNGMVDKRSALIARCAGVADVITAVGFARDRGLPVAVRGGGHNVAGNSVCDDGVVIDLSLMNSVRVDPEKGTVRAGGGVTILAVPLDALGKLPHAKLSALAALLAGSDLIAPVAAARHDQDDTVAC